MQPNEQPTTYGTQGVYPNPPYGQPPQPQQPKKPRRWPWILAAVVVGGAIIGAATSGNSTKKPQAQQSSTPPAPASSSHSKFHYTPPTGPAHVNGNTAVNAGRQKYLDALSSVWPGVPDHTVVSFGQSICRAFGRGATAEQLLKTGDKQKLAPSILAAGAYLCPYYKAQSRTLLNQPAPSSAPPPPPAPTYSVAQQQAIGSARDYLSIQAFSRRGLIGQLSSKFGDGFSRSVAVFAVNHLNVNWDREAAKAAKDYLSISHFSCSGLVQQLHSSYGDGYTLPQAQYGARAVGLC